jgi:8-oxo-dGTP diphosphatase
MHRREAPLAARKSARPKVPESEAEFLATYDPSQFQRPSVTVDVALLSAFEGALYALVVKRTEHPSRGRWALPGGFVPMEESLDAAAVRILAAKTGLASVFLEQLYTFGHPRRDPRTRVIAVAYYALVDRRRFAAAHAQGELSVARIAVPWSGETGGRVDLHDSRGATLPTAFDHADILGMAVKRVRGKLDYTPVGFQLLPETFTLLDLQRVHETVLGRPLNKDSFRRRMLATGELEATGEAEKDVGHRPAELYRFVKRSAV